MVLVRTCLFGNHIRHSEFTFSCRTASGCPKAFLDTWFRTRWWWWWCNVWFWIPVKQNFNRFTCVLNLVLRTSVLRVGVLWLGRRSLESRRSNRDLTNKLTLKSPLNTIIRILAFSSLGKTLFRVKQYRVGTFSHLRCVRRTYRSYLFILVSGRNFTDKRPLEPRFELDPTRKKKKTPNSNGSFDRFVRGSVQISNYTIWWYLTDRQLDIRGLVQQNTGFYFIENLARTSSSSADNVCCTFGNSFNMWFWTINAPSIFFVSNAATLTDIPADLFRYFSRRLHIFYVLGDNSRNPSTVRRKW